MNQANIGKQSGMTLLELILVLFLLGLLMSVVVSTLPNNDAKQAKLQMTQIKTGLKQLILESTLQGKLFGLKVTAHEWMFAEYEFTDNRSSTDEDNENLGDFSQNFSWQPLVNYRFKNNNRLPEEYKIALSLGELDSKMPANDLPIDADISQLSPVIFIYPGGEITPFTLSFYDDRENIIETLSINTQGDLVDTEKIE